MCLIVFLIYFDIKKIIKFFDENNKNIIFQIKSYIPHNFNLTEYYSEKDFINLFSSISNVSINNFETFYNSTNS